MSFEIHIPRYLHKERHSHRCPIHRRGKCKNACSGCDQCVFQEDNEICGKTLRGTGFDAHDFPCVACQTNWRGQYGGETLVDAFVNLEQAARHAKVVPDRALEDREEYEAESDTDMEDLVNARKRI